MPASCRSVVMVTPVEDAEHSPLEFLRDSIMRENGTHCGAAAAAGGRVGLVSSPDSEPRAVGLCAAQAARGTEAMQGRLTVGAAAAARVQPPEQTISHTHTP